MPGRARAAAVVTALAVLAFLAHATSASAEFFADLYAGAAFTQKADVTLKGNFLGIPLVEEKAEDVKFDNSMVFGGRVGYWSGAAPYAGIGLDVFHFQPDSQNFVGSDPSGIVFGVPGSATGRFDINVTAITLNVLLRLPLFTSDDLPSGRLQPYLSVGPGLFITQAKGEIKGEVSGQPFRASRSETDTSIGVQAGAGVAFSVHKNVALFGEYRFTHLSPDVEVSGIKFETNLNTHHLIGGISFRF